MEILVEISEVSLIKFQKQSQLNFLILIYQHSINIQSIFVMLLSFSFVFVTLYLFIQYYIKPKKQKNRLAKKFQDRGYRVHQRPIIPFLNSRIFQNTIDEGKGDAMRFFKSVLPEYDVDLGNMGKKLQIILLHPNLIKQFLNSENLNNFHKAQMYMKPFSRVMGNGLAMSEKENWKRKRRILSSVFNYDFISSMSPRIAEIFEQRLIETEKANGGSKKDIIQYRVSQFTSNASMRVVLECFLGYESQNIQVQGQDLSVFIIEMLNDTMSQIMDPVTFILGLQFAKKGFRKKDQDINRKLHIYHQWCKSYIHEKIQTFESKYNHVPKIKPKDLVETLIVQNLKENTQDNPDDMFTEKEIIDQFKTFLMVGTDTTSHYLQMMIFYISKHPNVEHKIRNEIEEHMKEKDFSVSNLKNFKYIEAVMKETTRIYGPANLIVTRSAIQDCYLDGVPIPKGVFIDYNSFPLHYNSEIYKQPFEFKPERWINGELDNIDPYHHIGFSAGPRSCIGRQLALLQTKIGLIKFMQRYESFSVPNQKLKMQIKFGYVSEEFNIETTKGI